MIGWALLVTMLAAAPAGAEDPRVPEVPSPIAPSSEFPGPWDALVYPLRRLYLEARALEVGGELAEAETRYQRLVELDPTWTQALVDLGRVQEAQGRLDDAEATYERAPYDADAVEALARLYDRTDRPERAARQYRRLRELRPDTRAFRIPEARATAATDPRAAADVLRELLDGGGADPGDEELFEAAGEVARALHRVGAVAEAAELLSLLLERVDPDAPSGSAAIARLQALAERLAIEQEARALAAAADEPLNPAQHARLMSAREAFGAGDLARAEATLRALLDEAPRSARAWAVLADVLEARGDIAGAEQAIRMAEGLAPLAAEHAARLGDLLSEHYGGRYDADAAAAYGRALQRHDAPPELWFRRGELLRRAGRPEAAVASFRRYLEVAPRGEHAEEARRVVEGWERQRPPPPEIPTAPGRPAHVPDAAWFAHHLAYVLYDRADGDPAGLRAALEALAPARALAPDFVDSLNLEAALRADLGELEVARSLYEESLTRRADQPEILVALSRLDAQTGRTDIAEARLARAATLGSATALLELARRDARAWRLLSARRRLDAWFANPGSGFDHDEAVRLQAEVQQRLRGLIAGGALLVAGGVGVPFAVRRRRRSGRPLDDLLQASPAAGREVARIASAIRHEVLKHHTTVLGSVAEALELRDTEPARWAADKLFGPTGAVARFHGYVEELRVLGAVYGVRLNLRHRDPVFGPLIEAMERLSALEEELRTGGGRKLAGELRELSFALNRAGYRALGSLIRRVSLLELDEAVLRETWEAVLREPAFREGPPVELRVELPPERVWLRIYRSDLHDLLVNLLRNALTATAEQGGGPVRVAVHTEDDAITGLERAAIRVADMAPRRITTAMIRGRYIDRGLGLAVDLVSRNGGSVHVEDEPGWSKAVVVRLPVAEHPGDEDPETEVR